MCWIKNSSGIENEYAWKREGRRFLTLLLVKTYAKSIAFGDVNITSQKDRVNQLQVFAVNSPSSLVNLIVWVINISLQRIHSHDWLVKRHTSGLISHRTYIKQPLSLYPIFLLLSVGNMCIVTKSPRTYA